MSRPRSFVKTFDCDIGDRSILDKRRVGRTAEIVIFMKSRLSRHGRSQSGPFLEFPDLQLVLINIHLLEASLASLMIDVERPYAGWSRPLLKLSRDANHLYYRSSQDPNERMIMAPSPNEMRSKYGFHRRSSLAADYDDDDDMRDELDRLNSAQLELQRELLSVMRTVETMHAVGDGAESEQSSGLFSGGHNDLWAPDNHAEEVEVEE